MTDSTLLELKKMPAILNLYRKAVMAKGSGFKQEQGMPEIEVNLKRVQLDKNNVAAYAKLCGFNFNGKSLPLTYPHILAFSLHMELMVNKAFPFPIMGLVHVRNEISAFRAINLDETLDIKVFLADGRQTDKGIDFDLTSQVFSRGELVWEGVSTYFYRKANKNAVKTAKIEPPALADYPYRQFWNLPESLGRSYAKISGDSNPIHLHGLSAKLFGFKRAIAHGMWSKARAISGLQPLLKSDAMKIVVEFKQPVYLPGKATMHYKEHELGAHFDLRNETGDKLHMTGEITLL